MWPGFLAFLRVFQAVPALVTAPLPFPLQICMITADFFLCKVEELICLGQRTRPDPSAGPCPCLGLFFN